jgi:ABC-type nitrate/sulfonate/bicarbonate transport system substrate-binding protein
LLLKAHRESFGGIHDESAERPYACFVLRCRGFAGSAPGQEKKPERSRIGGGAVGAPQMTMWFAKEANLYAKHGLAIEAISIPGSSMAIQAMLFGEVPIIQLGGTASMQANLAGADTVIVAIVLRKLLFSIFSRPEITRIADLKGKLFGATRFGTLSDFASRFALEKYGLNPERDITMVQTGGQPETVVALLTGKVQAAALSVPATMRAKKANMRELLDTATLGSDDPSERGGHNSQVSQDQRRHRVSFFVSVHRGRRARQKGQSVRDARDEEISLDH